MRESRRVATRRREHRDRVCPGGRPSDRARHRAVSRDRARAACPVPPTRRSCRRSHAPHGGYAPASGSEMSSSDDEGSVFVTTALERASQYGECRDEPEPLGTSIERIDKVQDTNSELVARSPRRIPVSRRATRSLGVADSGRDGAHRQLGLIGASSNPHLRLLQTGPHRIGQNPRQSRYRGFKLVESRLVHAWR